MKKLSVLFIAIIMIATASITFISASPENPIDARELERYGQYHIYLGDAVSGAKIPNVLDATVTENEYSYSYTYKKGDVASRLNEQDSNARIYDNVDGVTVYLSYTEDTLYIAQVTKDPNFVTEGKKQYEEDGFGLNIGFSDGGRNLDSSSRLTFDIFTKGNGTDINAVDMRCRQYRKNDDGSWMSLPNVTGDEYITGISIMYNPKTQLSTLELSIDLATHLEYWNNDLPLEEVRAYFVPFVYMYGESIAEAGDTVKQGVLWSCLPDSASNEMMIEFAIDYPNSTYKPTFFPNIIHFCDAPAQTTPPSTTTQAPTEPPVTTTKNPDTTTKPTINGTTAPSTNGTTAAVTTVAATTEAAQNGCGGAIALSALALVPMLGAAIVIGKKKD